jgi:hypothetical protein
MSLYQAFMTALALQGCIDPVSHKPHGFVDEPEAPSRRNMAAVNSALMVIDESCSLAAEELAKEHDMEVMLQWFRPKAHAHEDDAAVFRNWGQWWDDGKYEPAWDGERHFLLSLYQALKAKAARDAKQ